MENIHEQFIKDLVDSLDYKREDLLEKQKFIDVINQLLEKPNVFQSTNVDASIKNILTMLRND